jgi:hypothetical protein
VQVRTIVLVILLVFAGVESANADVRTLLLSQQLTPAGAPASTPLATSLVAQPGDTVGFQLVLRTPEPTLDAAIAADPLSAIPSWTRFDRIGFVTITTPSTGMHARPGAYEDPLPVYDAHHPLVTIPGRWGGFVVLIDVPRDATPGDSTATVTITASDGTPVASVPFTLHIARTVSLALDDPNAFKMIGAFRFSWYNQVGGLSLQHASAAAFLRQTTNIMQFLSAHRMAPDTWPLSLPEPNGSYPSRPDCPGCWFHAPGKFLPAFQGFGWSLRMIPSAATGAAQTAYDGARGPAFFHRVWSEWTQNGWLQNAYYMIADEPSLHDLRTVVPRRAAIIHRYAPGVKTLLIATPLDTTRSLRACKWFGDHACYSFPGKTDTVRQLWSGAASDPDIWLVPVKRWYGVYTPPVLAAAGYDRSRVTRRIIDRIRAAGHQVWTYTYSVGVPGIPSVAIDAPATDRHLLLLWNVYEGSNGWLHWGIARYVDPKNNNRARNPYQSPLALTGSVLANGEATLMYPGYAPQYGLTDRTAAPVSSLRLEQLREAAQWATTFNQYAAIYGQAKLRALLGRAFTSTTLRVVGGSTWMPYTTRGLAQRLDMIHRKAIAALDAAA